MKLSVLSLASIVLLAASAAPQYQVHQVDEGRVSINFLHDKIEAAGLRLDIQTTAETFGNEIEGMEGPFHGFEILPTSDLLFLSNREGGFQSYGILSGAVRVIGGFKLTSTTTGLSVDFSDFEIHPLPVVNDGPGGEPDPDYFFLATKGDADGTDFNLCYVKIAYMQDEPYMDMDGAEHEAPKKLSIKAWDLIVDETLADKLARPDLAGTLLGSGKIEATAQPYDGRWAYPDGQNPFTGLDTPPPPGGATCGTGLDVKLGILSSIKQMGHIGAHPNGTAGLSTSTTSCNVGDVTVPWIQPMNENHPGIAQALYRESNGRFEQVGVAWIKHGFFALANNQCDTCQGGHPAGDFLGICCSDTYGTSNNADRMYLGPRDEWNAYKNTWTCLGSFFDGIPVDCDRDQFGGGFNSVAHRLEVADGDLDNAGASYYYEAMYLVEDDVNIFNNIGSRTCTMSWNGFSWQFSTPGNEAPVVEGPTIYRWGEMHTVAGLEPDDGNVILAVETTDNGDGTWRYEYALFNWNLDRKVNTFSVPTCGNPTDIYFHDMDAFPENDWEATYSQVNQKGMLTWEFPNVFPVGDMVAGPLEFGTLYNFGFTSTKPPATRQAGLTLHEAGLGGDLLGVSTKAPQCVNLSAIPLAPIEGGTLDLVLRDGTDHALAAVTAVGGVPVVPPELLPGGPLPFVGDQATFSFPIPTGFDLSGLELTILGADVSTSPIKVIKLTNEINIKFQ